MLFGCVLSLTLVASTAGEVPREAIALEAARIAPEVVALRRDIHEHPELGNREYRTGKRVAARLRGLGLEVRYPIARTGVLGVLQGMGAGSTVVLRADLDALPIEEQHDVPYRSRNPGIMHACGHDAHTAIVAGVAEVLSRLRDRLPGTVVFLFQPAEEGPPPAEEGGAALVLKEGVLSELEPRAIFGLHVEPHLDSGVLGWTSGPSFASSDRFTIEVTGRPTHGAYPHLGVDPVPVAAAIVQGLDTLVTRATDAQRPKVLTIGRIEGGTRGGLVAERVRMEGTLRTLDEGVRQELKTAIPRFVGRTAEAFDGAARVSFEGGGLPPLVNDASLASELLPVLVRDLGPDRVREVEPQMGGEDFALYAQRLPAFYIRLGVRNESKGITGMLHTDGFDVDEEALAVGVRSLSSLVWAAASVPPAASARE